MIAREPNFLDINRSRSLEIIFESELFHYHPKLFRIPTFVARTPNIPKDVFLDQLDRKSSDPP